jgi:hypothetical protein
MDHVICVARESMMGLPFFYFDFATSELAEIFFMSKSSKESATAVRKMQLLQSTKIPQLHFSKMTEV